MEDISNSTLKVFHVGGRAGFGPTDVLLKMRNDLHMTLFEADITDTTYDSFPEDFKRDRGISVSIAKRCLSNTIGEKTFYINFDAAASSLYNIDPEAQNWTHSCRRKWGELCRTVNSVTLAVTTINELQKNNEVQSPDFLSIDAQGAECDILEGASTALEDSLVGIVTEVEFSPIYEGQKLFTDQASLLKKYQFNLAELYNKELWYPGPVMGEGHLMVAEALFLRDYRYFVNRYKDSIPQLLSTLAKLAIVSFYFSRTSYAFKVIEHLANNLKNEWDEYVAVNNNKYLHDLVKFYTQIQQALPNP